MNTSQQPKRKTCPACGRRVAVKDHPSPAWRLLKDHDDHDGDRCPGSGRSVAEVADWLRTAS